MANTMYFTQCEDCENCSLEYTTPFCEKYDHIIDNPEVDGCTWGDKKDDGERREGE